MANNVNCENSYTYLLSEPKECELYVKERKDSLCSDTAIKNAYKGVCTSGSTLNDSKPISSNSEQNRPIPALNWGALDSQTQVSVIVLILIMILGVFGYIVYTVIKPILDKRKRNYFIRVKFPNPDELKEPKFLSSMQSFFSSVHRLLKGRRMTFEIHKVEKSIQMLISYNDEKIGESIKGYLTSIEGVLIEDFDEEEDPINKYSDLFSYRLTLIKDFYTININERSFFKEIVDYLASLEEKDQAGVMFVLRPTEKKSKIDAELLKRDQRLEKSKANLEVYKNEKENLVQKQSTNLYLVNIHTLGNSTRSREGISSIFNSLDYKNSFTFKSGLPREELKTRYSPFENVFIGLFRKSFGSYLNAEELAVMIHPSKLERGKYKTHETVVLEAEPEFIEEREDNILIGKSVLKTGKNVNVFLPIKNLERHLYLAGSTGMGKSTVLIRLYLSLAEKQSQTGLILFDPHGEDLLEIAYRIPDWSNIIYFNLAESSKTFTFNPLFTLRKSLKDKDNKVEQIMKILSEEAEKKNKDLGTSIEKLLKFLVQTAVHFPDAYFQYLVKNGHSSEDAERIVYERQITFADLPYILQPNSEYQNVIKTVFYDYEEDIALKWSEQFSTYLMNKGILDGVDNRLSFVVQDSLVDLFEGRSFDINKAIAEHKRILMPISEQSFGKISKKIVTKFFLNEIWSESQSVTRSEDRNECVIFIDEFQEAQLDIIDDLLAQARKYKIRLIFGNQFLGQLWDNIRKSVLGNVSTLFSFKVQNLEEAETIAPMFKNKISPEDIVSLPKFSSYLRTLNSQGSDDVAFMSFKTISYKDEIPTLHDYNDLLKLNEDCLSKYGEEKKIIKQRRIFKIKNPYKWFIELVPLENITNPT